MIQIGEILKVLAFLLCIMGVYVAMGLVLYRRYVSKARTPFTWKSRVVLAMAMAGFLCILYGRFVEPRWVEVTKTRVTSAHLPPGHRGVRIVHLTDIHSDPSPLLESRLPALVAELKPDLIVFTGDAANSPEGVPVFRACITSLARIAPTFAVRGNWDVLSFPEIGRFAGTGVVELDGTSASIVVDGAVVQVLGVAFEGAMGPLGSALSKLPADGPAIVLYHCPYPDIIPAASAKRVDLMCAGHVHGGQVALPFYGALLTLSKFGKRFERGFYPDADGYGFPLYVSRGIGMEGGSGFRVRFCSRPEIALLELVPAAP